MGSWSRGHLFSAFFIPHDRGGRYKNDSRDGGNFRTGKGQRFCFCRVTPGSSLVIKKAFASGNTDGEAVLFLCLCQAFSHYRTMGTLLCAGTGWEAGSYSVCLLPLSWHGHLHGVEKWKSMVKEEGTVKKVMAVWDRDICYASRLADFINGKGGIGYRVVPFSSESCFLEYSRSHEVALLLAGTGISDSCLETVPAERIVYLEEERRTEEEKIPAVYKYQSAEQVMRRIAALMVDKKEGKSVALRERGKVIGVYSPAGRCGKTGFSLALAREWADKKRVLYVNLEMCSGFQILAGESYRKCLSDLLYVYGSGTCAWEGIGAFVYHWGGVDYIPPVRYPEDLENMDGEELAAFLEELAAEGGYDILVVDMGAMAGHSADVMEICDLTYLPVLEDRISQAKIKEFEDYLDRSGRDGIWERLKKLRFPTEGQWGFDGNDPDQVRWGEMGRLAKQLVGEAEWIEEI